LTDVCQALWRIYSGDNKLRLLSIDIFRLDVPNRLTVFLRRLWAYFEALYFLYIMNS
jgi:hypothetical protein